LPMRISNADFLGFAKLEMRISNAGSFLGKPS